MQRSLADADEASLLAPALKHRGRLGALFVALAVVVVVFGLLYGAQIKRVVDDLIGKAPTALVPDASPTPAARAAASNKPVVVGKVVFEGAASGDAACCACGKIDASSIAQKFKPADGADDDACRASVDPCELVKDADVHGTPRCWTVDTLCQAGVVPTGKQGSNRLCVLQETCGAGCGWFGHRVHPHLQSVTLPAGIQMSATRESGCTGKVEWQKACYEGVGCRWERPDRKANNGMRFGVAPGYQLQCGGQTYHGAAVPT